LSVTPPAHLYRARGQAYQTLGEFERAQADYGAALAGAEATDDRQTAWQALLDLGLLWASRDYAQAGDYFRQALERARALGDRATVAHSLNRLGNWHMNIDQPREGLRYHEEALAIFEGLHDRRGIAETLDLLGLASGMGGDLVQATAYFEEAVALFRELDDRQALSSSLATRIVLGWAYRTETMVPGAADLAACARDGEMALEIARDIGWRAGEAYALLELGYYLGPHGDYARALGYARAGLEVAQDIEHRQWMTGAYCALGALHLDLLALPQARQHLEQALALAKEVGSRHWFRTATGHLAGVYILEDDLALAEQILDDALSVDTPCRTIGQRIVWCARGELALAAGDPALALQVADLLIATASNLTPEQAIPWVGRLRGEALTALGRTDEAEVELHAAQETAHALGVLPMLWRIHVALGKLYRATARPEEAEGEFRAARAIIEELAANIPDEALRENFLQQATYG
jgi:tetratricopeptide (TPR) repeat protein